MASGTSHDNSDKKKVQCVRIFVFLSTTCYVFLDIHLAMTDEFLYPPSQQHTRTCKMIAQDQPCSVANFPNNLGQECMALLLPNLTQSCECSNQ